MQQRDYLAYYATQFKTVEIDSTYYGTPSRNLSQLGRGGVQIVRTASCELFLRGVLLGS